MAQPSSTVLRSADRSSKNARYWSVAVVLVELFFCFVFVTNNSETFAFDWDAYMEQVSSFADDGVYDYAELLGDNGPLVYPAGHVYIYNQLRKATEWDFTTMTTESVTKNRTSEAAPLYFRVSKRTFDVKRERPEVNIRRAKLIFLFIYLATLAVVSAIYCRTAAVPSWIAMLLCCTQRVRNIFVFGLFNDCVAMLILYVSVLLFTYRRWTVGCVLFSLAVSVKMNILLFAPGLLLLLLKTGGVRFAVRHISVCAAVQFVLGLPFLATAPISYVTAAFNIGRKFEQQWSINWHFMPASIFSSSLFGIALLVATVSLLFAFTKRQWCRHEQYVGSLVEGILGDGSLGNGPLTEEHIVTVLFTSNLIGIAFARSLHYQFFVWYFHTMPYLMWRSLLKSHVRFIVLFVLEYCWNLHPPGFWSSLGVQLCHAIVLYSLFFTPMAAPRLKPLSKKHRAV